MKYTRVDVELIKLVLSTPANQQVRWPDHVRGREMRNHRDWITRLAKSGKYKLENGRVFYKITFCGSIPPMNADGMSLNQPITSNLQIR